MNFNKPHNSEMPKQAPIEKNTYVEDVQNFKQELSPERIEQIMAKVQDIHELGTSFTVVGGDHYDDLAWTDKKDMVRKILKDGLLGSSLADNERKSIDRQKWVKNVREIKKGEVHYNILGRYKTGSGRITPHMSDAFYLGTNSVVIIFDSSKFKEEAPEKHKEEFTEKINTSRKKISDSKSMLDGGLGFTLSHRVAPRFFKGLVFTTAYTSVPKFNDEQIAAANKLAQELTELMTVNVKDDKSSVLLPVYDINGNLYWPKSMSYEEIKKFIVNRDEKNTADEEK